MGKRKPDYYTGIAIHGPERNFWSRYPYSTLMGRKNTYRKYYCGHCCLCIFKTWDVCHSCGQEIDWSHTDNWIGHPVKQMEEYIECLSEAMESIGNVVDTLEETIEGVAE